MGNINSGSLVFGVFFPEDFKLPWGPKNEYENLDDFWTKKLKRNDSCPYEIVHPGNYAYEDLVTTLLIFKDKVSNVWGNNILEIIPQQLSIEADQEEAEQIMGFCKENKIEFDKGPGWFLISG